MNSEKKNIPGLLIAFSIVIITEIMFFGGIISAYIIASSKATDWPPIDQPRLPFAVSLTNMLLLLVSGFMMYLFVTNVKKKILKPLFLNVALILGLIFLVIQGTEWIKLVNFGRITSDGLYASYFYSIIALHGFHVLIGLSLLLFLKFKIKNNPLKKTNTIRAFGMFWTLVCLLWPVLYYLLYLN